MNSKILFVDDEANVLSAYQRNLRKLFDVEVALGAKPALELLDHAGPFAVVVADMQMPGMNGIEFLIQTEAKAPDTIRIMLTGNADQKTAKDAVNHGHIFRFLTKPCSVEDLSHTLRLAIRQYHLVIAERELLEETLSGAVRLLAELLAHIDPQSFGFGRKTRELMRRFLGHYSYPQNWELEVAAELMQIGRVTLPPALLAKLSGGDSLTGPERDLIIRLPELGANLLRNIPRLENAAQIIRYQQKNYDGSGFPLDEVAGDSIPTGARILRIVAEVVRREAQGLSPERIFEQMHKRPGDFDPHALQAVGACFDLCPGEIAASEPASTTTKAITIRDACPGQLLAQEVKTMDGIMIVSAGTTLTPFMLQRLRNFAELDNLKQPLWIKSLVE